MASDAERRRKESTPEASEGKLTATSRETMVTTTSNSISVTPRSRCDIRRSLRSGLGRGLIITPTDDVGIISFPAGLAVGAERNDVGLIAVLARIFVEIRTAPGSIGMSCGRYGPAH